MKVLVYQFHLQKKGLTFAVNGDNIGFDYGEYWKLSSESCKKYADKYGFDYLLMSPTEDEWEPWFIPEPQFEQFRAVDFLKDYDAVLYVDTDVLIKPNSPNIVKKYYRKGVNIVLNTVIGNNIIEGTTGAVAGYNTGIVLYYKKSLNTDNLRKLKPEFHEGFGLFSLGDFIESRKELRWWERWDDFKPFIGKFKSGMHNDDRFMGFLINMFMLPVAHLGREFNYLFDPKDMNKILSDDVYFIHYIESYKKYMNDHYNLIME